MDEHRQCRCVKALHTTALLMPPTSEKAADTTVGGAGVMTQPTLSGLPRYVVAPKAGVPDKIGMKRKASIESGDGGPGGLGGRRMVAPGKRDKSEQPSPTYGRRQDRKLEPLRCTTRCTKHVDSSAVLAAKSASLPSGAVPVTASIAVVSLTPSRTTRSCRLRRN